METPLKCNVGPHAPPVTELADLAALRVAFTLYSILAFCIPSWHFVLHPGILYFILEFVLHPGILYSILVIHFTELRQTALI